MFVLNRYFNNKVYFSPWFRVHLKHCSSDPNASCDLEFDKNVLRLITTGAINLKKKQSEWNTLLCYEYLFYINNQVQVLKSFNSLLIQKFSMSPQGTSCKNFFPAHCTCVKLFWDDGLVQKFFFMHMHLQDIFFKITHPPQKVKWLALNMRRGQVLLGIVVTQRML